MAKAPRKPHRQRTVKSLAAEARMLSMAGEFTKAVDLLEPVAKYKTVQQALRPIRSLLEQQLEEARKVPIYQQLEAAQEAIQQGQAWRAETILNRVLEIDPEEQRALDLLQEAYDLLDQESTAPEEPQEVEPAAKEGAETTAVQDLLDRVNDLLAAESEDPDSKVSSGTEPLKADQAAYSRTEELEERAVALQPTPLKPAVPPEPAATPEPAPDPESAVSQDPAVGPDLTAAPELAVLPAKPHDTEELAGPVGAEPPKASRKSKATGGSQVEAAEGVGDGRTSPRPSGGRAAVKPATSVSGSKPQRIGSEIPGRSAKARGPLNRREKSQESAARQVRGSKPQPRPQKATPAPIDELRRRQETPAKSRPPDSPIKPRRKRSAPQPPRPSGIGSIPIRTGPTIPPRRKSRSRRWFPGVILVLLIVAIGAFNIDSVRSRFLPPAPQPPTPQLAPEAISVQISVHPSEDGLGIWTDGKDTRLRTPAVLTIEGFRGESVRVELRRVGGETIETAHWILGSPIPSLWEPRIEPPVPEPELLTVRSLPEGATLVVDGQNQGTTPARIDVLPTRRYQLDVDLDGHHPASLELSWEQLNEDQRSKKEILIELEPLSGKLVVIADYPAQVTVGGRSQGSTPRLEIDLPPGSHQVRASAPQVFLEPTHFTVEIENDKIQTLRLPEMFSVKISARPSSCEVWINGRRVDQSLPIRALDIVRGKHIFRFEWPRLQRTSTPRRIDIMTDNQEIREVLQLD